MTVAPPLPSAPADALARARQVGVILAAVAALIARRFLRDPRFFKLTGPLWSWLNRTVQRFGRVRMVPAAPVAAPRPQRVRTVPVDRVRLPSGRGWLVKALGWEAAGYGSQLDALLHEPEMVALLETVPAVGRLLRPLARMLGVTVGPVVVQAVAAVTPAVLVAVVPAVAAVVVPVAVPVVAEPRVPSDARVVDQHEGARVSVPSAKNSTTWQHRRWAE